MGQLGDLLREAREAKGLSLEQVEKTTNIRRKLLEALEQEAYGSLPAHVFVKGFLRNYARLLDLDPEQVVAVYKETVGDTDRPYELKALSEPLEEPANRAPWILAAFLVVVLALLGWWGYAQGLIKLPAWPVFGRQAATATLSPAVTPAQAAAPTETPAVVVVVSTATAQPTVAPTTPAAPAATATVSATLAATNTVTSTGTRSPTGTPGIPTATATVSPTPTVTETQPTPTPTATWPASDLPIQVALTSQMSVWLRVYTDGEKVFEGMMDQGTTRAWAAARQLYVHCGYANGVRAVVNGQEYGPLGPQADTVRIEWVLAAGTPSVSSVVKPTQVVVPPAATRAP